MFQFINVYFLITRLLWLVGRLGTRKPVWPHQLDEWCYCHPNIGPQSLWNWSFGGVFVLSIGFQIFCWYKGFCHRTESDLLCLFHVPASHSLFHIYVTSGAYDACIFFHKVFWFHRTTVSLIYQGIGYDVVLESFHLLFFRQLISVTDGYELNSISCAILFFFL